MKNRVLSLLVVLCVSCADVVITETTDTSVSDPTNAVAKNVGPVSETVTGEVQTQLTTILTSIGDYIEDQFDDVFEGGFLVDPRMQTIDDDPETFSVSISEVDSCTEGGTVSTTGTVDFVYNRTQGTGTYTTTLTTAYTGCQQTVLLETATGTCVLTPTIEGSIQTTLTGTYNIASSFQDVTSLQYDSDSSSSGTLDTSLEAESSQQVYQFDYALTTSTTKTGLSGTVEYSSRIYSVTEVSEFVENASKASVCP